MEAVAHFEEVSEWRPCVEGWFLRRRVGNLCREDLVQQCLIRLWHAHERGCEICRAYIHSVCESVWYDYLRQCQRRVPTIAIEDCLGCAVVEDGYSQVEARWIVEQALAQLSEREQVIVRRHYLHEESFPEIAESLGEPVERVKKACQRAIAKLQRWARENAGGGGGGRIIFSCELSPVMGLGR